MPTVGQVLAQKKVHDVCTIGPDASVFDAIRAMAEHNLGALIVTHEHRLVGVVTERDYARKVILMGRASRTTPVRDIMSANVIFVTPDTTTEECMALIINKYVRHLPVIEGGELIGIVSIGDIVKSSLGEKEFLIDELVRYITDSPFTTQQQRHDTYGQAQYAAAFQVLS